MGMTTSQSVPTDQYHYYCVPSARKQEENNVDSGTLDSYFMSAKKDDDEVKNAWLTGKLEEKIVPNMWAPTADSRNQS
uniref:Uncharacterized protein n=1 Tax=Oryza meridionalis TaxID=40149 RepID=A0A0E0DSH1_9ORYZ